MTERRYTEEEVAAIFERATDARQTSRRQLPPGEGMTLSELQEIGREVGIQPQAVALAAKSMDQVGRPAASRAFLGLPIGVGRTIELDRRLSDEEWDRLVVDLRETFDARGKVRQDGSFREWTNGNLQALLEPTETGHRLRLRTVKGNARSLMIAGLAMFGISTATLVGAAVTGSLGDAGSVSGVVTLAAMGLSLFGIGAVQLPRWARVRLEQMQGVAARLTSATKTLAPDPPAEES